MRTVPAELADLIPLDAHDEVAYVMQTLEARFPYARVDISFWMWAITLWTAQSLVELKGG